MSPTAGQPVMPVQGTTGMPLLAADIGGTHARLGLVYELPCPNGMHDRVHDYQSYRCSDHDSLGSIIRDFLDHHAGKRVSHGVLACAGYVLDGVVINENLPWRVSLDELCHSLELDDLTLINDFEAVAYATRYLDPAASATLPGTAREGNEGPQIVVGPGTGLGSAMLLPGSPQRTVLPTEAGQIALAPRNAREVEILTVLARENTHVSCERALSGPGLLNLYRAICTLENVPAEHTSPEAVTTAAMAGHDAPAQEALEVFCAMLGGFVGDLAMLYNAGGGVWLAGGILPKIRDFLVRSAFVERFLDKGQQMRAFLERVPVRLMQHGQLGVIGAAGWYLDHRVHASNAPTTSGEGRVDSDHRQ